MAKDRVQSAVNQAKKPTSIVQEETPVSAIPAETGSSPLVPDELPAEAGVGDIPEEPVQSAASEAQMSSEEVPSVEDIPSAPAAGAN